MSSHKRFQLDFTSSKNIEVQFYLEYDRSIVTIHDIHIHANFESGIPRTPKLELFNSKMTLFTDYETEEKGITTAKPEPILDNKYADEIVAEILKIKEQETPKFSA